MGLEGTSMRTGMGRSSMPSLTHLPQISRPVMETQFRFVCLNLLYSSAPHAYEKVGANAVGVSGFYPNSRSLGF
jgi:hypothetical protein